VRTYSLKALTKLFPYYGMEVFDVQRASRYGGNIRAYAGWKGAHPISPNVAKLLKTEEEAGLFDPKVWATWRKRVDDNRTEFMQLLYEAKSKGQKIVAASAPGRGVVLFNYYGLNVDLVPYIAEIPTGLKIGKYFPGTHQPVVSNEILFKEEPDYVIILAWHYADYIIADFKKRGLKSKFIVPLPQMRIE
jgi:nitrogen fixation protein